MTATPRFYVQDFTGYKIADRPYGNGNQQTSYYVMDRLNLHKVVATIENPQPSGGTSLARLRGIADRKCRELNEWHEREMASGALA